MFYIANSDETKFVMINGNNKNLVNSITKAAKFNDRKEACNALVTLPKRLRGITLKVIEINPVVEGSAIKTMLNEKIKGIDEIGDAMKTTLDSLQYIKNCKSFYQEEVSEYDKRIQVVLHDLEDIKFSASQGYKILKELQDIRKARRIAKNNLKIISLISDNTLKEINNVSEYIDKIPNLRYNPNK